jgi:hypothetical protein
MAMACDPKLSESERLMNKELANMFITAYETMKLPKDDDDDDDYQLDLDEDSLKVIEDLRLFINKLISFFVLSFRNKGLKPEQCNKNIYEGNFDDDYRNILYKIKDRKNLYRLELILRDFKSKSEFNQKKIKEWVCIIPSWMYNSIYNLINDINEFFDEIRLKNIVNVIEI